MFESVTSMPTILSSKRNEYLIEFVAWRLGPAIPSFLEYMGRSSALHRHRCTRRALSLV